MKLRWIEHSDLAIHKNPIVEREEYLAYMTFQRNDRPLFTEIFGPLVGLKEEWEQQGASKAELDFSTFHYRCEKRGNLPVYTGAFGGPKDVLLEETENFQYYRDHLGRTMKLSKGVSTLALPQDYPVIDMDSWMQIKPLYQFSKERFAENWIQKAKGFLADGKLVCVTIPGGFDEPRQLLGEERLCMAFYDQPSLIHEIITTISDTVYKVLDIVTQSVQIDILSIHEDMAGRAGPMVGPKILRQFITPYYRRIWDLVHPRGTQIFEQDSDGDMRPLIPSFIEAGVNCIYPVEPAANMDIVKLRAAYGKNLAFVGGIDKHVLKKNQVEILNELEYKIPLMIETGGCMLGLDHRIPNGTPLKNYRFYIAKVWEIMGRYT